MVNILVITLISISGFDPPFQKNLHCVSALLPEPFAICFRGGNPSPALIPPQRNGGQRAGEPVMVRHFHSPVKEAEGSLLTGSRKGVLAPERGPNEETSSRSCHALMWWEEPARDQSWCAEVAEWRSVQHLERRGMEQAWRSPTTAFFVSRLTDILAEGYKLIRIEDQTQAWIWRLTLNPTSAQEEFKFKTITVLQALCICDLLKTNVLPTACPHPSSSSLNNEPAQL